MITYLQNRASLAYNILIDKWSYKQVLVYVLVCLTINAAALTKDTLITDSALQRQRIINHAFDNIFEENLKLSVAGNDYYNPVKTQLTADLAPEFILFSTPKSHFFFVMTTRIKIRLLASKGAPVKSR